MKCQKWQFRSGWFCKLPDGHDGPCPAWPRLWAHPVWWFRMHVS